jgi:UDP-arabinose 4-epimerase
VKRNVVVVTGGAGYVGSHACKALSAAGFEPVTYDSLQRGHREAVRWGPLVVGDIADTERVKTTLVHYRPVAVMHFAALAYVGESVREPADYYRNNVSGTLSLLDAMRVCNVNRLIFSSTCATYGAPARQPIREGATQRPINPYGRSKLMVERILDDYASAYGLRTAILRYFNACGADPDGEIGELHQPETHLIPRAFLAATGHIPALEVWGTDYPTPDGTCVRDFIHVCDLAAGHVRALEHLMQGGNSLALNLGTGKGVSVREVIRAVRSVTGMGVPTKDCGRRPGDPPILLADARAARAQLGLEPRFSNIQQIIETAWRWYCAQYNLSALV